MQEGLAALAGYARIFQEHVRLSGKIPQISVICGASAGGGSYSPALTDFVVMTERANMFLTGPAVVRDVMGEDVSAADLGGYKVHERNGVAHFVARDDADAALLVRDLIDHLPSNDGERAPRWRSSEPVGYDPGEPVPEDERKVYDVRDVVRGIVDGGRLLEYAPRWARNIVCGFARIDGRPVGVVANQPKYLGGVLDAEAGSKAARFVRTCNAFGLPLVVLVDTPGFMPGTRQEQGGVIRHGAKLVHAFAEATVPKVTVVLRKAFGGAFIAMNSRDLGADYVFAWPRATLGVMGAKQAVGIVNRRDIAAADDPEAMRNEFAERYTTEHLTSGIAAAEGYVDEVDPSVRHPPPARRGPVNPRCHRAPGAWSEEHPPMTLNWSAPYEELEAGQTFTTRGRTVTEADVVGFAALTGDWHPQHTDAVWAAESPFGERIAHGLLVVSLRGRARAVRPRPRGRAAPRRRRRPSSAR